MRSGEATLLRIYIGNDDTYLDKPLYDQIVLKARAMDLAGATVTRGVLAFGPASNELQIVLRLSEDLPIVIDIIDEDDKIKAFLPIVDEMIESGVITTQPVTVVRYGRRRHKR